jgi:hypothetical protein
MQRLLYIARDEIELGKLPEAEALELLDSGFLRTTDLCWTEGMSDWKPLGELPATLPPTGKPGFIKSAGRKAGAAAGTLISGATRVTKKIKSLQRAGQDLLTDSARHALDGFAPQLRKIISRQIVGQPVAKVRSMIHDEEFMRKFFGATYDCLPRPVYRFVPEAVFVDYCLQRRRELLGPGAAGGATSGKSPGDA